MLEGTICTKSGGKWSLEMSWSVGGSAVPLVRTVFNTVYLQPRFELPTAFPYLFRLSLGQVWQMTAFLWDPEDHQQVSGNAA